MNSFVARYHSITANRRYPNPWAIATKGELRHLQNSEQGVIPLENGLIAREKSCAFPFRFHIAHTIHQLAPCALPAIRREETVAETVEGALQGGSCTMMSPSSCRFSLADGSSSLHYVALTYVPQNLSPASTEQSHVLK